MPFTKGDPNINRAGRPKKPMKSNTELRAMIKEFLGSILDPDKMLEEFEALKPDQKFKVRGDLAKFVLPDPISLSKLTPEELQELHDFIKDMMNDEQDKSFTINPDANSRSAS
jgi:hypothetical protein